MQEPSKTIQELIDEKIKELKEQLADIEHQRWADWQRYCHSKCLPVLDKSPKYSGGLLMPQELVKHWERQIETDYSELSEKEKDSDREQVDRYLPLLVQSLQDIAQKEYQRGYKDGFEKGQYGLSDVEESAYNQAIDRAISEISCLKRG